MRIGGLGFIAVAGSLALRGRTAIAAPSKPAAYTCTGGEIPSGNYASITVTGVCNIGPMP